MTEVIRSILKGDIALAFSMSLIILDYWMTLRSQPCIRRYGNKIGKPQFLTKIPSMVLLDKTFLSCAFCFCKNQFVLPLTSNMITLLQCLTAIKNIKICSDDILYEKINEDMFAKTEYYIKWKNTPTLIFSNITHMILTWDQWDQVLSLIRVNFFTHISVGGF